MSASSEEAEPREGAAPPEAGEDARTDATRRPRRLLSFASVVLGAWAAMHAYVGVRIVEAGVLGVVATTALLVMLGALFPALRVAERAFEVRPPAWLGHVAAAWMGFLFLALVCLAAADLAVLIAAAPAVATRRAALVAAGLLSVVALVLGTRAPRIVRSEVEVGSLAPALDGTSLVHLTDLHLGTLLGERWLRAVVARVNALAPDLVVLTGDVLDDPPHELRHLVPTLAALRAPSGVWAVTGNHEYYVGLRASVALFEEAGMRVLRDECAQASPGLTLAGVDDLTARRQLGVGRPREAFETALRKRPEEDATVLLCHSPLGVDEAASLGVDLMLCGHTHGGQLWPFGAFVRMIYKDLAGVRRIGRMTLLVSRGTGTWGPRMRLFRRAEIHHVRLRRTDGAPQALRA